MTLRGHMYLAANAPHPLATRSSSDKLLRNEFKKLIQQIGEDPSREGLVKTPERAAKALEFLTQGYSQSLDKIVNKAVFESDSDEMVIVKNIELYSMCEHHMLPFIGQCHVAYLPHGKVIGLSKIARIVDMYARRLQIQENLTKQIADAVLQVTEGQGVGCLLYTSPSPRDQRGSRMPSSA